VSLFRALALERVMADQVRDKVRDFILENYLFTTDTSALGLDDSLLEKGVIDSSGMMEIIFFIEEKLGVAMRDDEMTPANLDSVNKIAAFVQGKLQGA
jgi:acyl carrier protein